MTEWLEFGALGLLAVVIVLNYRVGTAMVDKFATSLAEIGRDCHEHAGKREERLIAALEKNSDAYERAIQSNARIEAVVNGRQ